MAEAVGVVASGIAVAQLGVTIGGAVLKLKQFWDQVNDAPETISRLIGHIELIYPFVWDFERQANHSGLPPTLWDSETATGSLLYCHKAFTKLSDVVDDLSVQITSRRGFKKKLAAFKVVLKKDELKRLEDQLRDALDILQFAQESYNRALLTAMHADIAALKLQQSIQFNNPTAVHPFKEKASFPDFSEQEEDQMPDTTVPRTVKHSKRCNVNPWRPSSSFGTILIRTGSGQFDAEFRPPWWLTDLASSFSFHMSRYRSTWDIQLRLYSERPRTDRVFSLAKYGDIDGLQSLFDQRKASPFDRDDDGWTLLHYSLATCQLEVTRLLLEMGAESTQIDEWGYIPLQLLGFNYDLSSEQKLRNGYELARLLLPEVDMPDSDSQLSEPTCNCPTTNSWDIFQRIQPILCPFHHNTTLESRLKKLDWILYGDVRIQRFLLEPEWSINPETLCNHFSLLHHVTYKFAFNFHVDCDKPQIKGLHRFVKDIMRITTDLHPLQPGPYYIEPHQIYITPFIKLMTRMMKMLDESYCRHSKPPTMLNKVLQRWIEALVEAGGDIVEYGKREHDILLNINLESHLSCAAGIMFSPDVQFPMKRCEFRLYGFTYGPNVEDWTILYNEPTDQFAGEFWDLVEDRPLDMPGAWFD